MANYKILFLVVILVVEDEAAVISKNESLESGIARMNEDIRFAGTADGKTFFAVTNNTVSLTWFQARDACRSMNMKLAEITSKAQADAIRSFADSGQIFDVHYWVGGRDAWKHRQISWDTTNEEVLEVIGDVTYGSIDMPLSCIFFLPCSSCNGRGKIDIDACDRTYRYRLCEVPTSSKSIWSKYVSL